MLVKKLVKVVSLGLICAGIVGCSSRNNGANDSSVNGDAFREVNLSHERLVNRNTVYFAFNKYAIETEDESKVAEYAKKLRADAKLKLRISGHTDATGSREYNIGLSHRRAEAVKNVLVADGIAANRLIVVGYGKEQPATFGDSEASYALNRRAVMDIEG